MRMKSFFLLLITTICCAQEVSFKITPLKPVEELRKEATKKTPPDESGKGIEFRKNELTELVKLDRSIHLEIRYATTNNFMGTPMYSQARAFLQKPAAEALVRVHKKLAAQGYGLLIHDGYRPWYVTWMFWNATPEDKKIFVADPAEGSKHNRGCAVDLAMYDRKTEKPVNFPSGYDEMSERSFADYAGGTAEQNQHRKLLREAMEAEGFVQNPKEWWHYDYKDWKLYRIGNVKFEDLK
jgi:D-alanyl-D-alanine dipeptidase